jgi:uncharacterized cupin superfamily protein
MADIVHLPAVRASPGEKHPLGDLFDLSIFGVNLARLSPGMCAGFPAGGTPHHLENRSNADVVILEVGDRLPGDQGTYPDDDL